jgi:hypothetical protein
VAEQLGVRQALKYNKLGESDLTISEITLGTVSLCQTLKLSFTCFACRDICLHEDGSLFGIIAMQQVLGRKKIQSCWLEILEKAATLTTQSAHVHCLLLITTMKSSQNCLWMLQ